MVRQHQTSDAQLRIGESRDSGFARREPRNDSSHRDAHRNQGGQKRVCAVPTIYPNRRLEWWALRFAQPAIYNAEADVTRLLDHLVGKQQNRRWHRYSDHAGGLEVGDELEASRPLDRQVRDHGALQHFAR